MYCTFRESKER